MLTICICVVTQKFPKDVSISFQVFFLIRQNKQFIYFSETSKNWFNPSSHIASDAFYVGLTHVLQKCAI